MKKKSGQFKYWQLSQNSYFLSNSNYILSNIPLFRMGASHSSLSSFGISGFWRVFFAWRGLHLFEKKKKLTRIQIIFHIVPLQFFHLSLLNNFLLRKCSCLTIQAVTSTPHKLRSKLAVLDSLYYTPHPESDPVSQSRVSVLHILKII